jgi:hypothetical protein
MKSLILSISLLSLGGCATLERHPVFTAIGTAIIAGSIAASVQHHHDQREQRQSFNPECADGVIGSDFDPACRK